MKIVGTRVVIVRLKEEATPEQAVNVLAEVFGSLSRWRAQEATGLEQTFEPWGLSVQLMDLMDGVVEGGTPDALPEVVVVPLVADEEIRAAEDEDAEELEEEQDDEDRTADGARLAAPDAGSVGDLPPSDPGEGGPAEAVPSDPPPVDPDQGPGPRHDLRRGTQDPKEVGAKPPFEQSAAEAGKVDGAIE